MFRFLHTCISAEQELRHWMYRLAPNAHSRILPRLAVRWSLICFFSFLPTYLHTYLRTYIPTYIHTYLPTIVTPLHITSIHLTFSFSTHLHFSFHLHAVYLSNSPLLFQILNICHIIISTLSTC